MSNLASLYGMPFESRLLMIYRDMYDEFVMDSSIIMDKNLPYAFRLLFQKWEELSNGEQHLKVKAYSGSPSLFREEVTLVFLKGQGTAGSTKLWNLRFCINPLVDYSTYLAWFSLLLVVRLYLCTVFHDKMSMGHLYYPSLLIWPFCIKVRWIF